MDTDANIVFCLMLLFYATCCCGVAAIVGAVIDWIERRR